MPELKPLFVVVALDRHDKLITWAASTVHQWAAKTVLERAQHKLDLGLVVCPIERTVDLKLPGHVEPNEEIVRELLRKELKS